MRRGLLAVALCAGLLCAQASPAPASIVLGQLAPDTTSLSSCANGWDWIQPTVISGNSYVAPEVGAITSWSTTAPTGPGQNLAFKIFRRVTSAPGNTYAVTAQDGPHPLTLGSVNTFAVNLPVQAGDVIGLSTPTGNGVACQFTVDGESYLSRTPPLAVGQQGDFGAFSTCCRNNETAVLDPQNSFTLGGLARNKKKGTAIATATVPNPGSITLSGKGVKQAGASTAGTAGSVPAPGTVQLTIRAKGKSRKKLDATGKVKVNATITYTPTGGSPRAETLKVKLKKKL